MVLKNNESNHLLSNIAVNGKHGENSAYFDGWKAYERDPFHPTNNPQGVIQMGLAENQLCFDRIQEWIRNHPEASICTPEGLHQFRDIAIFQDYHGLPKFRKGVASLMSKVRGGRVKFDPERIVMSGGATGANEQVMFCLANPGDAFLIPAPFYPAFTRDLCWRTRVQIIPVHCDSSNNFKITRTNIEAAYMKAQEDKINVRGLLITNPSNPLGTTLDKETLKGLVQFINENNIHLVCDEIYAATVFNSSSFVSVSEIIQDMEFCNKDLIHVVYSLSKDMGLPGFRVGIVYSYNDTVVNRGRSMSSFGLVSSQTQHMLAEMLSDDDFVEKFLAENSRRLAQRHDAFTKGLEKMGIACLPSNAGLFCWMNLRSMLKEQQTVEGEMMLWRMIVNDVKLNVSPGSSFNCLEPGWFRVCIANMDDETMNVALKRIQDFVGKETKKPVKVKQSQGLNLRVSFSSRRFDETVLSSPHIISPHSSHSPLVKAT